MASLSARGLLADDTISGSGLELVASIESRIKSTTAPLWDGLSADDVAAAERVLNELLERARGVLASA